MNSGSKLVELISKYCNLLTCGKYSRILVDNAFNMKVMEDNNYVDVEERERLEFDLKELIKEYKRAKRKHEPFEPKGSWYNQAIIDRVKEQGTKATIEGIHLPLLNYYRKTLAQEMEKNGYEDLDIIKWVYPDNWIKKLTTGWDWRTDEY